MEVVYVKWNESLFWQSESSNLTGNLNLLITKFTLIENDYAINETIAEKYVCEVLCYAAPLSTFIETFFF